MAGSVLGFSHDGKVLYLLSARQVNTLGAVEVDVASGTERTIARDDGYDANLVLHHPRQRYVQAVGFYRERQEWAFVDRQFADDFSRAATLDSGDVHLFHRDIEDRYWIVSFDEDSHPSRYYLYNRATREGQLLFSTRPALDGAALERSTPISFRARDGLVIHGYLILPLGPPPQNLPVVVLVHGGPWLRYRGGFHTETQWLANRGYAVLLVNFRGSSGYGKSFLNAGNREWGGKMQDDLIDGVKWILRKGIGDKRRVAVMGASYGGYAALMGLALTPDVFAAGIAISAPTNLVTLLEDVPRYWSPVRSELVRRIGDPDRDRDFLASRSPVSVADRIKAPLLMAHGANDSRVMRSESERMVAAIRAHGGEVKSIVYGDEGHGLTQPHNRLHFYGVVERFLARYLGGQLEPSGDGPQSLPACDHDQRPI